MLNSEKTLLIRQSDNGKWEVRMRGGKWVICETEADAKILSYAPVLEALWLKTRPLNNVLAARLEKTAEKMNQYKMRTDARRFQKWANLARGNQNGRK